MTRARVEVRLEEDEQPAAVARGSERGRDLRRMVCVVVVHLDTAGLTAALEPATRAGELGEDGLCFCAADARTLECRDRAGGVAPIVLARQRERTDIRGQLPARHDRRH